VRRPPHLTATAGALAAGGTVFATAWLWTLDDAGRDLTSFPERRLPVMVLLVVLVLAAIAPLGVLAWSHDAVAAGGLALAGVAVLLPLWASWPALDPRWRALALALGSLTCAGLALVARSWAGAALATAAAALHALAYDPFRDVGCARTCLEASAFIEMPTARLALGMALALSGVAVLVVGRAVRRGKQVAAVAVGAVVLAALAIVRWRTVGDADAYSATLLLAVPVPGLVAVPTVVAWTLAARRRTAVRRLAQHLAEEPDGLLELGSTVDVSLLSAGQQLALRNAQLAAEARERLAEVRAAQRRVVAAADAERRRIERDLHDGTQQRLGGVLLQLSGRGMEEVEHQIKGVLAELRTFNRGNFPPVLEEEGLEVALAELANTSDAEIRTEFEVDRPVPAEQARAIYALVLRSASDAGSRAAPVVLHVSVRSRDDGIDVTVTGAVRVDLVDVQDRFGALGGTLDVHSGEIEGNLP
jgi:signal transduction histidine kinase